MVESSVLCKTTGGWKEIEFIFIARKIRANDGSVGDSWFWGTSAD
jgi:hypothetical protein